MTTTVGSTSMCLVPQMKIRLASMHPLGAGLLPRVGRKGSHFNSYSVALSAEQQGVANPRVGGRNKRVIRRSPRHRPSTPLLSSD